MMIFKNNRGDTIVEVLFATVILSMILAGAFTISNRATQTNQNAVEKSQVTNQLREQAELIKVVAENTPADLRAKVKVGPVNSAQPNVCDGSQVNNLAFFVDVNSLSVEDYVYNPGNPSTSADPYPGDLFEVWVEAYSPAGTNYTDFVVRSCWEGLGSGPVSRTGMILRINDL